MGHLQRVQAEEQFPAITPPLRAYKRSAVPMTSGKAFHTRPVGGREDFHSAANQRAAVRE